MAAASPRSPSSAFPGFTTLTPTTHHYSAPTNPPRGSTDPELIILLTWMSAAPKHILKYVKLYQQHYRASSILLLTNDVYDMFYPTSYHATRLASAVLAIQSTLRDTVGANHPPRILLHCFSNGGSNLACRLAGLYAAKTGTPLPVRTMLIDSAPGTGTIRGGSRAMAYSLPSNPLVRFLGIGLIWFILICYGIYHELTRRDDVITILRRGLNSRHLFNPAAPRCYLYSKADELVAWQDVEAHADEAEAAGWSVRRTRFEYTPHAGHIMGEVNLKRYWAAVDETWRSSEGAV